MPVIPTFISRYFTTEEPKPPPISTRTAVLLLVLYTFAYVAPFYLSPRTRPSLTLSRDAPSVIRARTASVSLSCALCSFTTFVILTFGYGGQAPAATVPEALHALGYWPVGLREAACCLLLTTLLFVGPLFETLVVDGGWRDLLALRLVSRVCSEWTTWRNIVVGPLTEEILFRSASVPLLLLSGASAWRTIALAPLVFGLAHLHHYYEARVSRPSEPRATAVLRSAFQLTYTTLFGAYAAFLFLRSGSLLTAVLAHAFCNCMGLPRVWGRVKRWDDGGGAKPRDDLWWTVTYYGLLFLICEDDRSEVN
ncbi:CaaX protease [Durotheca rogersii]|uniref:CaaX protease n=1 Tax=Durotheca rogersii TaxID=419775 RepID=UPI002220D4BB|nr:CaaX protease [Durotheca rogersii]KAI5855595.1 CaaX protease [Durotheca rogersii]